MNTKWLDDRFNRAMLTDIVTDVIEYGSIIAGVTSVIEEPRNYYLAAGAGAVFLISRRFKYVGNVVMTQEVSDGREKRSENVSG